MIVRRTRYELKQAEARAHILEGFLIALDWLDQVIAMIRAAAAPPEAEQQLMAGLFVAGRPAGGHPRGDSESIRPFRNSGPGHPGNAAAAPLTGLERQKMHNEAAEVRATIQRLLQILAEKPRSRPSWARN